MLKETLRSKLGKLKLLISDQQCLSWDISSFRIVERRNTLRFTANSQSPTFCSEQAACVGNLQAVDVD